MSAAAEAERLVVTGATGFIGSRFVRLASARAIPVLALLRQGHANRRLDVQGVESLETDLETQSLLRVVTEKDVIVHIGGPGLSEIIAGRESDRENISGLIGAANARGVRKFIYLSSIKAREPFERDGVDSWRFRGIDAYGRKKQREENLLCERARCPWTIIRAPVVFGYPDRKSFALFAMTQRRFVPLLPERASARFSMIHVDDLASILLAATQLDTAVEQICEVANEPPLTWNELVALLSPASAIRAPCPVMLLAAAFGILARLSSHRDAKLAIIRDRIEDVTRSDWICDNPVPLPECLRATTPVAESLLETLRLYQSAGWFFPNSAARSHARA